MNKYLLITSDGFTQDMDGVDIENCQGLGYAEGKNFQEAVEKFKKENPWFLNYMLENITGYKVVSFEEVI